MSHPVSKRSFVLGAAALGLAGCGRRAESLPAADQVIVNKSERRLYLVKGNKALRKYAVELGFAPQGHKMMEGDGRTPEGVYFIDRKNPRSDFYLSLGLNYPNATDRARAQAMGVRPGGDIFIHGGPRPSIDRGGPDWTAGCIAVTDRQIEEIYALVRLGTPITIQA